MADYKRLDSDGLSYYTEQIAEKINGVSGIELTQAEYNALTEEEKLNGKTYFITDADATDDIFSFKSGEQFVVNRYLCSGVLSNGNKTITFFIPLPKNPTSNAHFATNAMMNIRLSDGGYTTIQGGAYVSGGYNYSAAWSACEVTSCAFGLNVAITFATNAAATNNQVICATLESLTLEF